MIPRLRVHCLVKKGGPWHHDGVGIGQDNENHNIGCHAINKTRDGQRLMGCFSHQVLCKTKKHLLETYEGVEETQI